MISIQRWKTLTVEYIISGISQLLISGMSSILAAEILPQPWKAVFIVWAILSFVAIFADPLLLILPWPDRLVDLLARFDFPPFYPLSPFMLLVFSVLSIVAGITCGHVGMIVAGAVIISIYLFLLIVALTTNRSPDPSNLQND